MFKVAFVCEGPADRVILEAVLDTHLEDYNATEIQPPTSNIGGTAGLFGGGWRGVQRWCEQGTSGGQLTTLLANHDLLILQVDCDVAYEQEHAPAPSCPPPSKAVAKVTKLVLDWLVRTSLPEGVLLCTPAMATETWAFLALFPEDERIQSCGLQGATSECIECRTDVKTILNEVGRKLKLVVRKNNALKNQPTAYQAVSDRISGNWANVKNVCSQASIFDAKLRTATGSVSQ